MLVTLSGRVMLVNPVQPENADVPIVVKPTGITTFVSSVQPLKAKFPMLVTFGGNVNTPDRPVQFAKAELLIAVSVLGRFMVCKNGLFAKTPLGIVVTPSGTVISVRLLQPANTLPVFEPDTVAQLLG